MSLARETAPKGQSQSGQEPLSRQLSQSQIAPQEIWVLMSPGQRAQLLRSMVCLGRQLIQLQGQTAVEVKHESE
jgi:hypothetical protein